MRKIDIVEIDPALLADLGGNATGCELHEQAVSASAQWQIIYKPEHARAGLVFVGSGSNGRTHWTDATSPADAYQRMQRGEMMA